MTMTSTAMKMESPSRHNNKPAMLTLSKTAVDDEFVVFPKPVKVITSPLKTKSARYEKKFYNFTNDLAFLASSGPPLPFPL